MEFTPYKITETLEYMFYQVPMELFFNTNYKNNLSLEAKMLYGLLLSQLTLSIKNNWQDENGNVYIILTREKAQELLNISDKTATKAFKQLNKCKLIYEKKQGQTKPNLIYVGKIEHDDSIPNMIRKNYDSRVGKNTIHDSENLRPNYIAREKMHNASTIAGMAFTNAFLGVCHSMAHKIGAEFHLPHGRINAILLPYVIRYNATEPTKFVSWPQYEYYIANQKYATIAKKIGLKADTVEEGVDSLIAEVRKMNEELNIPKSFKDAGVDEKEFLAKVDLLADRAFEDQCTTANPRVPLISEIKQILLDSYYGK